MAVRPLTEAVQQAEEAISGGNYQLAVETCRRVLGQFPEFATAHRLLAEAYLEEGDVAAAERAFNETLQRDPQSAAAFAGLATIADGRGDSNGALAYAQAAWEIMPQREDLRDRVTVLSERLFGKGGRLHLTRAALTSLHFRAGRWSRAAAEAASVLAEHPMRVDVQLRMAEALWRRGSLPAAAKACRAVLDSAPSAVMALLMLADIERRQGNQETATQLLDRARAIDPNGVHAADLVTIGENDLADFILPARTAEFDDSVELTTEVERPRIAPAPDFSWTQPTEVEKPAEVDRLVAETSVAPETVEASAATDEGGFDVSLPDDAEIEAARPTGERPHGYTSMLESLHDEGLKPFRLEGDESDDSDEGFAPAAEATSAEEVFGLVSDEEIDAARPPDERPHGYTSLLNSLDESGLSPFEVEGESGYPTEPAVPTESVAEVEMPTAAPESVDYGTDLTAGWDDIDAEIERATPPDEASLKDYTGQLRDLDEIGIQPFSMETVDDEVNAEAEFADEIDLDASYGDDLAFLDAAPVAEGDRPDRNMSMSVDVDLTDGWASIDEEIQNAIPTETPPGYTDELNELNESGVEPFFVEADELDLDEEVETEELVAESGEDRVPDDLAVGIDLWTFENEPDTVASNIDTDATQVETEAVSDADLFDFADTESGDESPFEVVEESQPAEPAATAPVDEPIEVVEESQPTELAGNAPVDELVDEQILTSEPQAASLVETDLVEPVVEDLPVESAVSPVADKWPEEAVRAAIAHLGVDALLFDRVRGAKAQMIESGRIQGDQLLPGVEPPGPSLEMLEQMVQENAEDQDLRRQFAEALLAVEAFERAFSEYQWMFRKRLSFDDQDLSNLNQVTDRGREHQVAGHRLLGAIYRRSGNFGLSAHHYQLSLSGYRGDVGKEA